AFLHSTNPIILSACAEPCIASADYGTCQQTDIKCLCTSNAFVAGTTACIQSKCTGDDLTKAQTVATGLCSSVVRLDIRAH
ncbi:hypothetical protein CPB83DRAFT_762026, partial [Crepidotus variabilis]